MTGMTGCLFYKPSSQARETLDQGLWDVSSGEARDEARFLVARDAEAGGIASARSWRASFLEDERLVVAFQGRLTNRAELARHLRMLSRASVMESGIVAELYLRHGRGMAEALKGRFCFSLWDKRKKRLWVGTDRYGYGYLYYYRDSQRFVFSTEIHPVLRLMGRAPVPNMDGICDIHNFQTVYGNDTPFADVFLLPHATLCRVDERGPAFFRYWEYPKSSEHLAVREDELIEQAKGHVSAAVASCVQGHERVGVLITGGLDSRLISGVLKNTCPDRDVRLFHIHSGVNNETSIVNRISSVLDLPLEILGSDPETPPDLGALISEHIRLTDGHWGFIDFLPYIRQIREEHGDILLLGGYLLDTMFKSGFAFFPKDDGESILVTTADYAKRFAFVGDYVADLVFVPEFARRLKRRKLERIDEANRGFADARPTETSLRFYCVNRGRRAIYFDSRNFEKVVPMDFPGIHCDLQSFAMRLPYSLRSSSRFYRRMICELCPDLAEVEWDKTGRPLSHGDVRKPEWLRERVFKMKYLAQRATRGGIDLLHSYRSFDRRFRQNRHFRDQVCALLRDERTVSRGFIDRKGVERLIKRELSGRDHGDVLQSLLSVEFLYRGFFDG